MVQAEMEPIQLELPVFNQWPLQTTKTSLAPREWIEENSVPNGHQVGDGHISPEIKQQISEGTKPKDVFFSSWRQSRL